MAAILMYNYFLLLLFREGKMSDSICIDVFANSVSYQYWEYLYLLLLLLVLVLLCL